MSPLPPSKSLHSKILFLQPNPFPNPYLPAYSRSVNWNRTGAAKFNREVLRISKEQILIEKNYQQSVRKLKAAQRGVISMLGKDLYPDLNPDTVLFEHNDPGFCYRRNGEPRRRFLLAESKTRKIIHDMEGKEGILPEPASNVLSDNPILSELLSCREIVSILCDLRTTSAILDDPQLYRQFEIAMVNNPPNPLPFKGAVEDSLRCLRRYRINLIHEFFDALSVQTQLRLRFGDGQGMDKGTNFKQMLGFDTVEGSQDRLDDSKLTEKEWTEALLERLKEIVLDEEQSPTASSPHTIDSPNDDNEDTAKNNDLMPSGKRVPVVSIAPVAPENTENVGPDSGTHSSHGKPSSLRPIPQSRIARRKRKSVLDKTRQSRREFDKFVRSLISEIENVREVDKSMHALRRKNPTRLFKSTEPLIRLLGKNSLFASLNLNKLHQIEGSEGLGMIPSMEKMKPKSEGKPKESISSASLLMLKHRNPNQLTASFSDTNYRSTIPRRLISSQVGIKKLAAQHAFVHKSLSLGQAQGPPLRSVNRVCCEACKAKQKILCNQFRERDFKDKIQVSTAPWKTPGNSDNWTRNYRPGNGNSPAKQQHLLTGLPTVSLGTKFPMSSLQNFNTLSLENLPNYNYLTGSSQILAYQKLNLPSYYFGSVVKEQGMAMSSSKQGKPIKQKNQMHSSTAHSKFQIKNVKPMKMQLRSKSNFHNRSIDGPILPSPNSWTLKVSTMDIVKLRHELDLESVRQKIENFTNEISKDISQHAHS